MVAGPLTMRRTRGLLLCGTLISFLVFRALVNLYGRLCALAFSVPFATCDPGTRTRTPIPGALSPLPLFVSRRIPLLALLRLSRRPCRTRILRDRADVPHCSADAPFRSSSSASTPSTPATPPAARWRASIQCARHSRPGIRRSVRHVASGHCIAWRQDTSGRRR